MMMLPCPWCGPRDAGEFRQAGELVPRPDPARANPEQWRAYLYLRANARGWVRKPGITGWAAAATWCSSGTPRPTSSAPPPAESPPAESTPADAPATDAPPANTPATDSVTAAPQGAEPGGRP